MNVYVIENKRDNYKYMVIIYKEKENIGRFRKKKEKIC